MKSAGPGGHPWSLIQILAQPSLDRSNEVSGSRGPPLVVNPNLGAAKFGSKQNGAGEGIRTLDLFLGKEAL